MNTKKITTLILLLYSLFSLLNAQTYQEYNPNSERFRIIALEMAKIRLEYSEQQWRNARELFEQNLISQNDFHQYELQYKSDRLNFDMYMLSVIFDNPYINIVQADKIRDINGEVFVELIIKNTSGGNYGLEESLMEDIAGTNLSITGMYNLYISIKDMNRTIISQPYEYHITRLNFEEEYSIRFRLLKDVESAIVSTNYGDRVAEKQIYFTRRQDRSLITVIPDIYAQEIETGQMATFRLSMEYFGDIRQSFTAEMEGLPEIFTWDVFSTQSNVTMSRLVFSPAETRQNYGLRIRVPERVGNNVEFDVPIEFNMLLKNAQNEVAGIAELQIVPTGRVSMRLIVNNLYWKGNDTQEIVFSQIRLENEGMRPITNVSAEIFLPANWEYEITPQRIEILNPGERIPIEIKIKMPSNVLPGIYQLRYRMIGNSVNRNLQTSEIEFRAEVVKKTNVLVILFSVVLSLAVIVGAIVFIIKISKN
ncbi:MAG: NEW3 domain-containing protein [Candidatus Cloacimonetes bacterium]|nr:NEW3 domain-containing protein [Candidatus Cloacimonadota bacterium]